jgi:5-methylcytosine-specific restriction endonuclease McrA
LNQYPCVVCATLTMGIWRNERCIPCKRGATALQRMEPVTEDLRRAVFARDEYRCVVSGCRSRKLQCDHIIPRMHMGKTELANLQTLCLFHNLSKKGQLVWPLSMSPGTRYEEWPYEF